MKNDTGLCCLVKIKWYGLLFITIVLLNACASRTSPSSDQSLADSAVTEELDSILSEAYEKFGLKHGTSIAIVKNDRIIYNKAFGYADIGQKIKTDINTSFYIASITKPITALSAMILDEKGLIDLNKSLQDYFPDANFHPGIQAKKITLIHLLTHTSGIKNDALTSRTAYSGEHTPSLLERLVVESSEPSKTPLGEYQYSNVGYNIFSVIVERELNKPWQSVLEDYVFEPIMMNRTSAYISHAKEKEWQLAKNYSMLSEEAFKALPLMKQDNTMHAAGGVIASSNDLARLIIAQLNDGVIDNNRYFPEGMIVKSQKKLADQESKYLIYDRNGIAMGWIVGELQGKELLHHFGWFPGFHPHVSFMPQHKIGLVVLNNEDFISPRLTGVIAQFVYGRLLGKENVKKIAQKQLDELHQKSIVQLAKHKSHRENRKKNEWQFSQPLKTFYGVYEHPHYGRISMTSGKENGIVVTYGNMQSIAEPFKRTNSIRVELLPINGQVIQFVMNNGKPHSLKYDGMIFYRTDQ